MSMMTVPISMYGWKHSNKGLSVKNVKNKNYTGLVEFLVVPLTKLVGNLLLKEKN